MFLSPRSLRLLICEVGQHVEPTCGCWGKVLGCGKCGAHETDEDKDDQDECWTPGDRR